jgi:N-dimethylarginine dimethylaminohydrolase
MSGTSGTIVMASPDHYEVFYSINPWMRPDAWGRDPALLRGLARRQWSALAEALRGAGLAVEVVPACPGLPDMVFPANAAVVLDRRALLARFRYPERRGEEPRFHAFFQGLADRGLLAELHTLPDGVFQEGAGDCLWDCGRQLFWAAYGPRSSRESHGHIARVFGQTVVPLELVTDRFYHLDTCFSVLPGGEVMYYPAALSPDSQAAVAALVPEPLRIAATEDETASFSLNTVAIGRDLIMTAPPERLRLLLEGRGYRCRPVELSAFLLSGGASYCMTLRLDLASKAAAKAAE